MFSHTQSVLQQIRVKSLEDWANKIGIPGGVLYFVSMFIYPAFISGGKWSHVHAVWETWQTFNAAMLAFLASLIALNISRVKEENQRKREFFAARAFLPAAFNALSTYFRQSASYLAKCWDKDLNRTAPAPSVDYRQVFADCIRHATPEVGQYLSDLLGKLQIHEARLEDMSEGGTSGDQYNLIAYLYSLGDMKVLVNKQYQFARGKEPFNQTPAQWSDFENAYRNLELEIPEYEMDERMTLEAFTKRAIERRTKQNELNQPAPSQQAKTGHRR